MKFGIMCWFLCSIALVRIQNYSKNDFGKYEFTEEISRGFEINLKSLLKGLVLPCFIKKVLPILTTAF